MRTKVLAIAATAAALVAAPLQAANSASALSLSPSVRAGEAVDGENALFGGMIGSLVSLGVSVLTAYLAYEALDLGGDDEDPESA